MVLFVNMANGFKNNEFGPEDWEGTVVFLDTSSLTVESLKR